MTFKTKNLRDLVMIFVKLQKHGQAIKINFPWYFTWRYIPVEYRIYFSSFMVYGLREEPVFIHLYQSFFSSGLFSQWDERQILHGSIESYKGMRLSPYSKVLVNFQACLGSFLFLRWNLYYYKNILCNLNKY